LNVASKYPLVVEDMRGLILNLTQQMKPAFLPNRWDILEINLL
jgi:hypothetical protein